MAEKVPPPVVGSQETFNDKYVILYDFQNLETDEATAELTTLLEDLESVGLHTEVRPGFYQTILVLVKAPREILGNAVYKERVKDWLNGVSPVRPDGDKNTVVKGAFEAEDQLALYHLVNHPKENGGAGITPEIGKWENVKAIFPPQNKPQNQTLLRYLSRRFVLSVEDLDRIRDLHGSKVAFYFAFIQTYLMFLAFPAVTGILAWQFLSSYSLIFAICTSIWCTVFLEWWKTMEIDLSIRWRTRGVHAIKANRPQFQHTDIIVEKSGHTTYTFPRWKQITRQLIQIPFLLIALVALGTIITAVFALEVLISETYVGPYQYYLGYLPTVVLAVALPYITSSLEGVAEWLTEYENHRTADYHEMALTQKIFALNVITNYLPIFLTAFIYVPMGEQVVPQLEKLLVRLIGGGDKQFAVRAFEVDQDRLRNEVIALTVTGQVIGFMEENILPLVKHKLREYYRFYKKNYSSDIMLMTLCADDPEEAEFLERIRNESTLPMYSVQDDIAELVLQFGYLALFSPAWPLIPLGFFINNWVELRSDFAKICLEHRRPATVRADGIGAWIGALETLTWLGSISTAAIVHLFGTHTLGWGSWLTLPITIFVSEHFLLFFRSLVRWALDRWGSEQVRKERKERYAARLQVLEEIGANKRAGMELSVTEKERRKSVLLSGHDRFWTKQLEDGASAKAGLELFKKVQQARQEKGLDLKKD